MVENNWCGKSKLLVNETPYDSAQFNGFVVTAPPPRSETHSHTAASRSDQVDHENGLGAGAATPSFGQKQPLVAQGSFAVCSIKQVRFSLGQGDLLAGGEANLAPEYSRVRLSSAFSSLPMEALRLVSAVLTVGNPNSNSCQGDAIDDNDARKEAHLLKSSPRLEGVHRGILIKR